MSERLRQVYYHSAETGLLFLDATLPKNQRVCTGLSELLERLGGAELYRQDCIPFCGLHKTPATRAD